MWPVVLVLEFPGVMVSYMENQMTLPHPIQKTCAINTSDRRLSLSWYTEGPLWLQPSLLDVSRVFCQMHCCYFAGHAEYFTDFFLLPAPPKTWDMRQRTLEYKQKKIYILNKINWRITIRPQSHPTLVFLNLQKAFHLKDKAWHDEWADGLLWLALMFKIFCILYKLKCSPPSRQPFYFWLFAFASLKPVKPLEGCLYKQSHLNENKKSPELRIAVGYLTSPVLFNTPPSRT